LKKINFEKWLKEQGVNTKLCYKNCKRKHQNWDVDIEKDHFYRRRCLRYTNPQYWIRKAFAWDKAFQHKNIHFWAKLEMKWQKLLINKSKAKIIFGFKRNKK